MRCGALVGPAAETLHIPILHNRRVNYYVIGPDGKEYGPVPVDTLREWAGEGRVHPHTQVRSFENGTVGPASSVPNLFPPPAAVAPPPQANYATNPYANPTPHTGYRQPIPVDDNDTGPLWQVLWRCAAAIVLFFVLHGIGLIFAIYGVVFAAQAKGSGNKYGTICLIISIVTLLIVVAGWFVRLSGGGV